MIATARDASYATRLYDTADLPWISQLLTVVEHATDAPWRQLESAIERAPLEADPVHRQAIVQALRHRAQLCDRPATGAPWPEAAELAGIANLIVLQRWARKAHRLELRVWDRAVSLARRAARLGVIAELRRDRSADLDAAHGYVLDALGPLGVRHAALAYGRALGALIPEVARHARFTLDLHAELGGADVRLRIATPILLPEAVAPSPEPAAAIDQLAAELRALGWPAELDPAPIALADHVLLPGLAIPRGSTTRYVEVLAFSTRDHLVAKLARYRAAGRDAVLCVDRTHARDCDVDLPVLGFIRHVDVDDLRARLGRHG